MAFRLSNIKPAPDAFAAVMATGILSASAQDHHYGWLSDALAVVAVVMLAVLIALVLQHFSFSASDPDVCIGFFTFVAACSVLGARFESHQGLAWALTGIALVAWLVLVPLTARSLWAHRWVGLRARAHGSWELVSVSTSGLAIVMTHLPLVSLGLWSLAIGLYCLMTALILWRSITTRDDAVWRPDSWILMGGLAIATLAGDGLYRVDESSAVRAMTVVTWVLATAWILLLAYMTARHFTRDWLRGVSVWWGMVFPLGMYSAATFAMLREVGWPPFRVVSLVFFWIAFAAWLLVALLALRRAQMGWPRVRATR